MVSLIIPSYNNLRHLKNCYASLKNHEPKAEIIFINDASTDGTKEWLNELCEKDNNVVAFHFEDRKGHTYLYDYGINLAKNDIVGILHADMIVGPNYTNNMLKHLKPGVVVAGTRVEPPLHPPGKEKIIKNFGLDFDDLNVKAFEEFCVEQQSIDKDRTTRGMFAPWIIYKSDFEAIGGHDQLFAPFPYEDSDIFQRWILAGYELIQSRDALVYHLTCRGHRWNEKIGVEDEYFKNSSHKSGRNYLRKWGSWIKNDEFQYPIVPPRYNIGYIITNSDKRVLDYYEPWCDSLFVEKEISLAVSEYINTEKKKTSYDLLSKIGFIGLDEPKNDVLVQFDATKVTQQSVQILQQLPQILEESGEPGEFELDIFKIKIQKLENRVTELIHTNK